MKKLLAISVAALALTAVPAAAKHHEAGDHSMHMAKVDAAALKTVIADKRRGDDAARDQFRHPLETLTFFNVSPDMTVAEYAPGGGWYTKILAPYLAEKGQYIGLNFAPDPLPFPQESKDRLKNWGADFPAKVAEMTGLSAEKFKGYSTDQIGDEQAGTVDLVIIPRMMHNLMRWNVADNEIKAMRKMLKDGGHIGIVQHRAKAGTPFSYADGNKGYLREDTVVAFMKANGFELVGESEVNANPKDTADYAGGVWTLPPGYRLKEVDKAKYTAIGESDRMTMLFKKLP